MTKFLIVLLLFPSVMTFGQEQKNQSIQFNGLYKTECEIDKDDDEGTQSYLRFYPDGKVLSVSTDCEASASDLKDWFNYENKNISIGSYISKRHKIQFSTTSKAGTVKYRGRIDKNGVIKLRSKSLINGRKDHEKYIFIQQNDMK